MFELNEIILAFTSYEKTRGTDLDWLAPISDDAFLDKYDRLTKKQKKTFQDRLEQARQEVISAEDPEELPAYHAQLEEIFSEFL